MTLIGERFRWIVLGGGAAGCWLAHRLEASGQGSVALVEAGMPTDDVRTRVPAWYPRAQNTRLDWAYRTEPQSALSGRRLAWPRGKCLGGSSAINALIAMAPSRGDLLRWSRLVGGRWPQWLAEFAQRFESPEGQDGPLGQRCAITGLNLEPVRETHPWCAEFLEAAARAGLTPRSPWVQAQADVCGSYALTATDARRQTTADRLLAGVAPAAATAAGPDDPPRRLTLRTGCHVHRIVLEKGRAVAAEITSATGARERLFADEAIFVTAGAIGSPELLLRSGIGSAAELQRCGIACQVNASAVGENLQDHLVMPVVLRMKTLAGLPYRFSREMRQRYRRSGTGPLASNLAEVGAMLGQVQLADAADDEAADTPRVQLHVTPTHYLKYPLLPAPADCMSIGITPLHPASRGRVRLTGSGDALRLEIDPNYLAEAADQLDFSQAASWISDTVASSELGDLVERQLIPGERRSDAAGMLRSVRTLAQSIYHPVGTCRAGRDTHSVVDDQFRVRGVEGLRVADASVLPDLPSGNTCAAAVLMAELAARGVLGD
ncbi:MAG: GMC family oxidoreductase [Aureliella sp.]